MLSGLQKDGSDWRMLFQKIGSSMEMTLFLSQGVLRMHQYSSRQGPKEMGFHITTKANRILKQMNLAL